MPKGWLNGAVCITGSLILAACGGGGSDANGVVEVVPTPIASPTPTPPAAAGPSDFASAPRRVAAQAINATTITLTWADATADETGFRVERRAFNSSIWQEVGLVAANMTLLRDASLTPQTAYEYRVTAIGTNGVAVPSVIASATTPSSATPSIFFVDTNGGNDSNAGTEASPWKTIQKAHDVMIPGQTVLVRAGTYIRSNYYTIVQINRSGTAAGYITYKAYPGERPKLKSTVRVNYNGFEVRANYIVVDGFEIEGHSADVDLAGAKADQEARQAGGPFTAYSTSNGISFGRNNTTDPVVHHVVARNNYVHDHPAGGINALNADYVLFEDNFSANNGRYSYVGGSGLNLYQLRNFDNNNEDYHNIIRNNISTGNTNEIPCACFGYRQPTDGNGIIVDVTNGTGYTGRTLIVNNLIYNNGGRGIHVFKSSNVDIIYNTTFRNSTIDITGEGEITTQEAGNVRVQNNIMFASDNRPVNLVLNVTNVIFDYNIIFGGTRFTANGGVNNRINTDPGFVATSGATAFQLRPDSPAIDTGQLGILLPADDYYRAPRPRGAASDVGAVESR